MKNRNCAFLILLNALVFGIFTAPAFGDQPYSFTPSRSDSADKNRWSLADWLQTRDKMRLMDLWLAIHSPSPYEFYVAANYQFGRVSAQYAYNGWDVTVGAYASIFGVEAQREITTVDNRWLALFHLRIFGQHDQATNITFEAGAKYVNFPADAYWTPVIGGKFTLYLTKFFGVEGLCRTSVATTSGTGTQYYGYLLSGGAFIDFKFLRVFAQYLYESEARIGPTGPNVFRSGLAGGLKLYL